ncbi:MAG TPA: DcaP family trimeric outer membrane transporter [Candidatus Eisenbacteria bacterium]|nr:DcaP family trimeric outer membrane transporter [Candidatus Eisenbacteria bacterium]
MRITGVLAVAFLATVATAQAQDGIRTDIYGFVMTDVGYNSDAMDPLWFDVQRPTKLESSEGEFGDDGSVFFSVRQTRFGIKSWIPTDLGELRTTFEWELFGTGVDAGQTTLRLRHAYGEMGKFGAGQYWSPFMDIDVFPNTIEYWGPNGMVFFRNVQLRVMPIQGDTRLTIALERPGASGDQGDYADRIDAVADIVPRFPLPDLSAEYRIGRQWGYVEAAGIVRQIEWDDIDGDPTDLSGTATGWGFNVSSNLKLGTSNVLRLQGVVGEGIQNYMNDAPADVGVEVDGSGNLDGVALRMTSMVAFLDHNWTDKLSSSVGYSQLRIENSNGQSDSAFKLGQYALANLLYSPVPQVMMGVEGGWIRRENNRDGFDTENYHVQLSFKYSFATTIGGGQ